MARPQLTTRIRLEQLEDRRLLATNWFELEEITNSLSLDSSDHLSYVDIDGGTLVIGNRFDDTEASNGGAVYVYNRSENGTPDILADDHWDLSQTIIPDDIQPGDLFGYSVVIKGDRMVVSSPHRSDFIPAGDGLGVAYIYQYIDGSWVFEQQIEPANRSNSNDLFGHFDAVALGADRIAIGSVWDTANGARSGAVHIFELDPSQPFGEQWSHQTKLLPSDGNTEDRFGFALDLDGGELAVSALFATGVSQQTGVVYTFEEVEVGAWQQTSRLFAPDGGFDDRFGSRLDLSGGTLIVGAHWNDAGGANAGAAYVFSKNGGNWELETKLESSNLETGDQFGWKVDIVDSTVAVLAPQGDSAVPDRGVVYLFEKIQGVWTETAQLSDSEASPTESVINFGRQTVGMDGGNIALIRDNSVFVFSQDQNYDRETRLSTDTPRSLSDARGNGAEGVTSSSVLLEQDLEVVDVNVRLDISHSNVDHLELFLIAPNGTRVELFSDIGGSGDNLVGTILDDDVTASITDGSAPFTGNFAPEGDLDSLVGIDSQGTWTLEVRDDTRGTRGTLENWSVSVLGRKKLPPAPTVSISDAIVTEGDSDIQFIDDFVAVNNGVIDSPEEILFGPDGLLYVASMGSGEILRFDPQNGAFVDVFVPGDGELYRPFGMAFTSSGNLLVSSRPNNHILEYDGATGDFVGEFVTAGSGGLERPNKFRYGPDGNLYVASRPTDEIYRYNGSTGSFIDVFVSSGSGGLSGPVTLDFGPDDDLFVSGEFGHIKRYDGSTGQYLEDFVFEGTGGLIRPLDMEFRPDGFLYVTSSLTHNVLQFDGTNGDFVGEFIPAGLGGMNNPSSFEFASDGNFYIGNRGSSICCNIGGSIKRYGSSSQTVFELSRSSHSSQVVEVDFSTIDGTALTGSDYVGTSGTVRFAPGQLKQSIIIQRLMTKPRNRTKCSKSFSAILVQVFRSVMESASARLSTMITSAATKICMLNNWCSNRELEASKIPFTMNEFVRSFVEIPMRTELPKRPTKLSRARSSPSKLQGQ